MKALRLAIHPAGALGRPPDWYLRIRAARYLGVAPWDLDDVPALWIHRALAAESAEIEAHNIAVKG